MRYYVRTGGDAGLRLDDVKTADHFLARFLGLMGRRQLGVGEGLLLKKVSCIHTCFMRFPICAVYLDKEFRILDKEVVKPWRCGKYCKRAAHVLELHPDQADYIRLADQLILEAGVQNPGDGGRRS